MTLPVLLVIAGAVLLGLGVMQTPQLVITQDPVTIAAPPSTARATAVAARPSPAGSSAGLRTRVATRIVIRDMGIDLPVIAQPGGSGSYPACGVAMYLQALSSPGYAGATYIYAHAREGMFLPLLEASKVDNGKAMLGMTIRVYTSDSQLFTYRVDAIHRHVSTMAPALAARDEELWLQTSEGPAGTVGKLELVAEPTSRTPVSAAQARPRPRPVNCG
jgi:hypothetical protein